MSTTSKSSDLLQVLFGIIGIVSILVALAGLHHRDSLACVLLRRVRRFRNISDVKRDHELEAGLLVNADMCPDAVSTRQATTSPGLMIHEPEDREPHNARRTEGSYQVGQHRTVMGNAHEPYIKYCRSMR
ncbi:hypothetical protein BKA63DRAFT_485037 [Paraphoma chrysanthemicola]|nr:hypothetical protein BKA63DRAFT_485037 [Paraphoma chrysanthemicola]